MNIVKIQGGLGNQMFQFAFGEYLRKLFDIEVKYDVSFFDDQSGYILSGNDKRNFDLIRVYPNVKEYLEKGDKLIVSPNSAKFLNKFLTRIGCIYLGGKIYRYHKDDLRKSRSFLRKDIKHKTYFDGYWQNLSYVEEVKGLLAQLYNHDTLKKVGNEYMNEILGTESVSLHIRRGDYLKSKLFRSMGIDYIHNSIAFILEQLSTPSIFLFTDDINWGESILNEIRVNYPNIKLVDNKSQIEDILMMSLCKHNIICNSTYSWWASFNNKNPNKIIVSPRSWTFDNNWNKVIIDSLLINVVKIGD